MFKMLKNKKGMTLVELLAVMVIVGIIAAISIPAIGNLIENARKDSVISTAQSMEEAARLYVASNGTQTGITLCATTTCTPTPKADLVTAGFLDAVPTDPKTKEAYTEAYVTVTFDSNGVPSYKVTLTKANGYQITNADASNLKRENIS